MVRPGDRRPFIADHAIAVLAAGGARALSHQAVDRSAGLPRGSTSYYFRSRHDLVVAALGRIREHSRAAFDAASPPTSITAPEAADRIEEQLHLLATQRRDHALAVFSLLPEVDGDPALRTSPADCLFSRRLAMDLFVALGAPEASRSSGDLIDFLIGILFSRLFGQRRDEPDRPTIASAVHRFLESQMGGRTRR